MQRKLMKDIKEKHTEILRLEQKQKIISVAIKEQKDKGYSPRTSKAAKEREQTQTENSIFRLEHEVKDLEETKQQTLRHQKQSYFSLVETLNEAKHDVKILETKLKEKDQELKLAELRVKELKKNVPNSKLRPLKQRTRTNRTNASVDNSSVDMAVYQEYDRRVNRKPSVPRAKAFRVRKATVETVSKRSNFITQAQRKASR